MAEDAVRVHQKFCILGLRIVTHEFCSGKDVDLWSSMSALRPLLSSLLHPALPHVPLPEAFTGQTLDNKDSGAPASLSSTGCPVLPCYRAHHAAPGHCSQFSWLDPWNNSHCLWTDPNCMHSCHLRDSSNKASFRQIFSIFQFWLDFLTGRSHEVFSTASPPRTAQRGGCLPLALMRTPRTNACSALLTGEHLSIVLPLIPSRTNIRSFCQEANGALKPFIFPPQSGKRRDNDWEHFEFSRAVARAKPCSTAEQFSSAGCRDKRNIADFITFAEAFSSPVPKPGPWNLPFVSTCLPSNYRINRQITPNSCLMNSNVL